MVYDANQLVALDRKRSNSWPNPPNYEYLKGTNVQKARLFLIKNRATVALANLLGAVNSTKRPKRCCKISEQLSQLHGAAAPAHLQLEHNNQFG